MKYAYAAPIIAHAFAGIAFAIHNREGAALAQFLGAGAFYLVYLFERSNLK